MKKNLSRLANYCQDRNTGCLFVGRTEKTLFFDVYGFSGLQGIKSAIVKQNFEQLLRADTPDLNVDIRYL